DALDALELLADLLAQLLVLPTSLAEPVLARILGSVAHLAERLEVILERRACLREHLLEPAGRDGSCGGVDVCGGVAQRHAERAHIRRHDLRFTAAELRGRFE